MTTTQRITMYQQIEQHGENLNAIFNTGLDNIKLCKKLHSLEIKANRIATDWCNGVIDSENIDTHTAPIMKTVSKILGDKYAVVFNGDARGYTLKIPSKVMQEHNLNLYTDWGGNGIIAPDFTPNN